MTAYVFIDVSHKQEFIYKNNKLKDNLYNSFIIKSVTEKMEKLDRESYKNSDKDKYDGVYLSGYLASNFGGNDDDKRFEFVYSGGGNSILKFNNLDDAETFIRGYSREVLREFPDLELYISLVADNKMAEKEIRDTLYERADLLKDKRKSSFRRWSYGIEKVDETGMPVSRISEPTASEKYSLAKECLYRNLDERLRDTAIFITDKIDSYKKAEEGKSYIGVIAIDGNKMGEMVKEICQFADLTSFSEIIESIYLEAVISSLQSWEQLYKGENKESIYITPVVMAGDDICLITEGEYALEIAASIVKEIEKISRQKYMGELKNFLGKNNDSLKACAGVAIVRYNYPFFEAVKTAESLCHRAKESIYKIKVKDNNQVNASFIDWDILQGPVEAATKYESYVKHGKYKERYHIKPLRLDQDTPVKKRIYSYNAFLQLTDELLESSISNSTLEKLKRVIYSGWEQYKLFFETKQIEDCDYLNQLVQNIYKDMNIGYAALEEKKDQTRVYTYILNDVLDIMPFIARKKGEE